MASRLTYSMLDYSGEKSNFSIPGPTLSAANYDATIALVSGVQAALGDITLGTVSREVLQASIDDISSANPGSPYAQRELKLMFVYTDDTSGKNFSFTVATPDLAALTTVSGSDEVVLADAGEMAAFVSAFEAFARSPEDPTHTVTVQSCRIVGRNL